MFFIYTTYLFLISSFVAFDEETYLIVLTISIIAILIYQSKVYLVWKKWARFVLWFILGVFFRVTAKFAEVSRSHYFGRFN